MVMRSFVSMSEYTLNRYKRVDGRVVVENGVPVKIGEYKCFAIDGIKGLDPRTLKGQYVLVDGDPFNVLGVEVFMVNDPTGMEFGMVVEPVTAEDFEL